MPRLEEDGQERGDAVGEPDDARVAQRPRARLGKALRQVQVERGRESPGGEEDDVEAVGADGVAVERGRHEPDETEEQEDARVRGAGLEDEDGGAQPQEEQPRQQPLEQEPHEVADGLDLARDVRLDQAAAAIDQVVEASCPAGGGGPRPGSRLPARRGGGRPWRARSRTARARRARPRAPPGGCPSPRSPGRAGRRSRQASSVVQAPRPEGQRQHRPPEPLLAQGSPLVFFLPLAVSTILLTARLKVQLGTTQECLPGPPATMT